MKIERTKIKAQKSEQILEGIIIDGKSFLELTELRKLGISVNWNAAAKTVEVEL